MLSTVGRLLGEISEDEHDAGHPLLSAIVVDKNSSLAGPGFFKLVRDLKLNLVDLYRQNRSENPGTGRLGSD